MKIINIRASPNGRKRKRIKEIYCSDVERKVFHKTNVKHLNNHQNVEIIVPPRWWMIFGSISIISIITGLIFNEVSIIPIMFFSSALTYLLIQIGNNLRLKKRIDFSTVFQNKYFSIKISVNGK